jgi:glycosyltransferase involved in cell wall biosynthesis
VRIAIVVWDLSVGGGTQRQALELARQLSASHTVHVYAYAYDPERCYPELTSGLEIRSVAREHPPGPDAMSPPRMFWYMGYGRFHAFDDLIRRLGRSIPEGYDVVNPHDTWTERVAHHYRGRFPATRVVWMSNDVPAAFKSLELNARNLRATRSLPRLGARLTLRALYAAERLAEVRYLRSVDSIVVLDERNRSLFERYAGRRPAIVRSGLDLAAFTPKLTKDNRAFTLLAAGIFFRYRRFEDAIDAVALLAREGREVELRVIGSDEFHPDYGEELRERARALGVEERVRFLGRVSEAELREEYRNADAFVFPNHEQTWGLAVFEAIASGTPAIVSRTTGASEVIEDGVTGLLVDPLDPPAIARAAASLMDGRDLYERLQREGRRYVEEHISWPIYAAAMEARFRAALAGAVDGPA